MNSEGRFGFVTNSQKNPSKHTIVLPLLNTEQSKNPFLKQQHKKPTWEFERSRYYQVHLSSSSPGGSLHPGCEVWSWPGRPGCWGSPEATEWPRPTTTSSLQSSTHQVQAHTHLRHTFTPTEGVTPWATIAPLSLQVLMKTVAKISGAKHSNPCSSQRQRLLPAAAFHVKRVVSSLPALI